MNTPATVPVIDLAPWFGGEPSAWARTAAAVDAACRSLGFLQVVGHGLAPSTIDTMHRATAQFFAQPLADKLRWRSPSPEIDRGYAARGDEGLAYSLGLEQPPDLFEAFNIGPEDVDLTDPAVASVRDLWFAANIWPDKPAGLPEALVEYFRAVRGVAHTLTDIFALALGLEDGYFRRFTTHSTDTMRVNHYQTAPGDPDPLEGQMGMGAHTDYGICTVLYADPVPGLQIIGPDGGWVDVIPEPGAFLVNLGDLIAEWTNDRWRSTIHRVVPPSRRPDGPSVRRSVAFFHDGNYDALVECLPTCHDTTNPPRYPPVLAGEHLLAKLLGPKTLSASDATDTARGRI